MGAEREDTDPASSKGGTEPGLGPGGPASGRGRDKPSGPHAVAEEPAPVDFDALHAALGAIQEVKGSIPPPPASPTSGHDPDLETSEAEIDAAELEPQPAAPRASSPGIGESRGRSSAQYASSRPHTIPPTRAPVEAPDMPAVIVADDTVPAAPPQMTAPIGQHSPSGPHAVPQSGPHSVPSPGPQMVAGPVSYPHTPQPFPVQGLGPQPTMRMPERPRRPRTPTVVVRPRGPSAFQKLAAFMLMLLLVTVAGVAVIVWRKPAWIGLEQFGVPPPTPASTTPLGARRAPIPVPMPLAVPSTGGGAAVNAAPVAASSSAASSSGGSSAPSSAAHTASAPTSTPAPPSPPPRPRRAHPRPAPVPVPIER